MPASRRGCNAVPLLAVLFLMASGALSSAAPATAPADVTRSALGDLSGSSRVVFVLDCSGSMLNKMAVAKGELIAAVSRLDPATEFDVLGFQDERVMEMNREWARADAAGKRKAGEFLDDVTTTGHTDPVPAIRAAFRLQPDRICLISDGDFPNERAVSTEVDRLLRQNRVRIDAIGLFAGREELEPMVAMRRMAARSGGTFRGLRDSSPANPLAGGPGYRLTLVPTADLPPVNQAELTDELPAPADPVTAPATRPGGESVFGDLGGAESVVFVCGSFAARPPKASRPKDELNRAILDGLRSEQKFEVLLSSDRGFLSPFPGGVLVSASPRNTRSASRFLGSLASRDGADPMPAVEKAFDVAPRALYLVTDGNLPRVEQVEARIRELNADGKVRVHTFVLGDGREEDPKCVEALRRVAAGNGGTFTHLTEKELERRK